MIKIKLSVWMPVGIVVAVIAGIASGFIFGSSMRSIAWIGTLFLNSLKMVVVPLVMSSLIVGISRLGDVRRLGGIGARTLIYYLITMALAVLTGMVLSNLLPVAAHSVTASAALDREVRDFSITDVIVGLVPENIFGAMAHTQILPLIVFSILFGSILTTLGPRGHQVRDFFVTIEEIMMKMIQLILWTSPIGIFGLVAGRLGQAGGGEAFLAELWSLRFYATTVIGGLLFHSLVTLPLMLLLIARRNPVVYLQNLFTPLSTAFSTASSSATIPLTLESSVQANGISKETAGFVIPLGATVNMDGTALYEAAAAMFIAQIYGLDLSLAEQTVIFFTATLAAIGAAGIPEAGLVTMVMVLQSVHLPVEGIALLLTVDWFLDRCRTTVNVWGDAVVAAIIDRYALRN